MIPEDPTDIPPNKRWKPPKLPTLPANINIGDLVFILKRPLPKGQGYSIDLDHFYHQDPSPVLEIHGSTILTKIKNVGYKMVGQDRIRSPAHTYTPISKCDLQNMLDEYKQHTLKHELNNTYRERVPKRTRTTNKETNIKKQKQC